MTWKLTLNLGNSFTKESRLSALLFTWACTSVFKPQSVLRCASFIIPLFPDPAFMWRWAPRHQPPHLQCPPPAPPLRSAGGLAPCWSGRRESGFSSRERKPGRHCIDCTHILFWRANVWHHTRLSAWKWPITTGIQCDYELLWDIMWCRLVVLPLTLFHF